MRILLLNQFFWPDSAATSQLLTDLARGLAQRGHEIRVICADAGYNVASAESQPAVHIHRVKTSAFTRGRIGRLASYLSFYVLAAVRAMMIPTQDVVVTLTTPPLLSLLGTLLKGVKSSRHFIWEMDVYPDVAVDLQYIKAGGVVDRTTGWLADFSRRHADGVIALGECMKERLANRGVDPHRIFVVNNWADSSAIPAAPVDAAVKDKLVVLYSGNLGLAHDVETVTRAILHLTDDDRFRFLFIGSGERIRELASFASVHNLQSVEIRPYVDRLKLGESLASGDIGLVTQRDACCGSIVPSKVYGLLAAGRPILFVGPRKATPAEIIRRFHCGWHIACGDDSGLVQLLRHLITHPEEVQRAGANARRALLDTYDLPIGVERLASILGAGSRDLPASEVSPVLSGRA